ncbi:MAG: hypothetical protein LBR44_03235 [Clostridiales Family XIII bacterium]|jgi:hypothetical protein|nr:hypothetical protein [Clostridiales Family XIII bacterium]
MAIEIKVSKTHYENRCKACEEREQGEGEPEMQSTQAGKNFYIVTCEPQGRKSPCRIGNAQERENAAAQPPARPAGQERGRRRGPEQGRRRGAGQEQGQGQGQGQGQRQGQRRRRREKPNGQ